jgi:SNF2 family DNA or RNA helicase
VPTGPHLIIVPTSLVDQWASEIQRFMRSDVRVVVVSSKKKEWRKNMDQIRDTTVSSMNVIVLVSHLVRVGVVLTPHMS